MEEKKKLSTKGQSIWSKNFIIMFIVATFIYMSSYMTNTLLPLYSKELGAKDAMVGTIVSMFYTAALLFRPVSGPMSDALDRKKLLIVMGLLDAACFVGYAFSGSVTMLIITRLCHGITYGTVASLTLTLASASLPAAFMATGLGVFAVSQILPQAIGPGIGLGLADKLGFKYAYLLAAVSVAIACLLALMLEPEQREKKKIKINLKSIIAPEAIIPTAVLTVIAISAAAVTSFLVLTVNSRGIEGLSTYYIISAVLLVVLRPVMGRLADKYGNERFIIISLSVFIANLFLLAHCNSTMELWLFGVLQAVGYSSAFSLTQALAMKLTPAERRGSASSSCYLGTDLGMMIGSNLAGILAEKLGYGGMFMSMTVPLVIGIAIIVVYMIKSRAASDR